MVVVSVSFQVRHPSRQFVDNGLLFLNGPNQEGTEVLISYGFLMAGYFDHLWHHIGTFVVVQAELLFRVMMVVWVLVVMFPLEANRRKAADQIQGIFDAFFPVHMFSGEVQIEHPGASLYIEFEIFGRCTNADFAVLIDINPIFTLVDIAFGMIGSAKGRSCLEHETTGCVGLQYCVRIVGPQGQVRRSACRFFIDNGNSRIDGRWVLGKADLKGSAFGIPDLQIGTGITGSHAQIRFFIDGDRRHDDLRAFAALPGIVLKLEPAVRICREPGYIAVQCLLECFTAALMAPRQGGCICLVGHQEQVTAALRVADMKHRPGVFHADACLRLIIIAAGKYHQRWRHGNQFSGSDRLFGRIYMPETETCFRGRFRVHLLVIYPNQ